MPESIRYHFTQCFKFSAQKVFNWCTDYDPEDYELMGDKGVERYISHITSSTILLRDVFQTSTGQMEKQKLVELYPDTLSWTSTHLTGPNKYSQFLYKISLEGNEESILDFTGLHIEYGEKELDKSEAKTLAYRLCKEDAQAWKLLAKAMEKELRTKT
ncbi:MAG: hypothetical protein QG670_1043 [Thermoproteota archaeon]|nr:hypothetical protein [Thermoproteota archaeon]